MYQKNDGQALSAEQQEENRPSSIVVRHPGHREIGVYLRRDPAVAKSG
jgi:hypothetical protein